MKTQMLAGLIALSLTTALPQMLRAEDNIEKAGVAVGVSAGNMWFLPIKYLIVMPVEAFFGAGLVQQGHGHHGKGAVAHQFDRGFTAGAAAHRCDLAWP